MLCEPSRESGQGDKMKHSLQVTTVIIVLSLTALATGSPTMDDGPARKLINSQGCKACHALETHGGKAAPSFEKMRATLSRTEIRLQLVNPEHRHGKGRIADFSNLSAAEVDALVVFIKPEP
jgi:hypothetical protein